MDEEKELNRLLQPMNITVRSGGQFFVESQSARTACSDACREEPGVEDTQDKEGGTEKC